LAENEVQIPNEMLSQVETLNLSEKIDSTDDFIKIIPFLTSLKALDISRNNLSSISFAAGLASLESVILSNNPIADLSPLSQLSELKSIAADNCAIVTLPNMTQLSKLETLSLSGNSGLESLGLMETTLPSAMQIKALYLDNCAIPESKLLSLPSTYKAMTELGITDGVSLNTAKYNQIVNMLLDDGNALVKIRINSGEWIDSVYAAETAYFFTWSDYKNAGTISKQRLSISLKT
jgi:Leucine-rich repeat (LRR) protein